MGETGTGGREHQEQVGTETKAAVGEQGSQLPCLLLSALSGQTPQGTCPVPFIPSCSIPSHPVPAAPLPAEEAWGSSGSRRQAATRDPPCDLDMDIMFAPSDVFRPWRCTTETSEFPTAQSAQRCWTQTKAALTLSATGTVSSCPVYLGYFCARPHALTPLSSRWM